MGYLANKSDVQVFQPAIDYFSGNGSTAQFTLSRPVASVAQIIVSVANVIQNPNTFSVNNNILTLGGNAPAGTNNIWVQYQTAVIQVNQPGQGTVGAGQMVPGAAAANLGNGGVTAAMLAAGAAASNLGSFVSSVNGQTGAVTVSASGLGIGQTWQNMTSSRAAATNYTNSTGKPIAIVCRASWITRNGQAVYVDGQMIGYWGIENNYGTQVTMFAIVPNGSYYSCNVGCDLWMELR